MCSLYTTTSKLRVFGLAIFGYLLLHACKGSYFKSYTSCVYQSEYIYSSDAFRNSALQGRIRDFFMGRWLIPIGHQTTREVILSCLTAI